MMTPQEQPDSQAGDELDKHHDDDCTINVISEGYPCICWVKDYRAYAERLAAEARIDELHILEKYEYDNVTTSDQFMSIPAYVKDRITALSATLTKGEKHEYN